jgi:hypothetical protein
MNSLLLTILSAAFLLIFPDEMNMKQKDRSQTVKFQTEWKLAKIFKDMPQGIELSGKPEIVDSKYGKAVFFNGLSDGIFLNKMPLSGLTEFTIEVIFQPQSGGNFEQRFLHFGETQGDRVLLELRSTGTDWYFDAFIKVADQNCTLIEPRLLHPLDKWYHVAYVIDNGKLTTYINGIKELEGNIIMSPLKGDKTSIGVRQNAVSWFKGNIFKIRITGEVLQPESFIKH